LPYSRGSGGVVDKTRTDRVVIIKTAPQLDKEPHCTTMLRREFHQEIQNHLHILPGVARLQLIIDKEIRQHLPKHPPAQPGLTDSLGMDAMMHFDLGLIDGRVAELANPFGDEKLLIGQ
jgi:hypothetical protein